MNKKLITEEDILNKFHFENNFYLTSKVDRIGKLLAHYELYKMILDIPGNVVECGVFKGVSLIRFAGFRDLLESPYSRRIIGFDIFGDFPNTQFSSDIKYRDKFIEEAGSKSISKNELETIFAYKNIVNYSLIKGDILETVPRYSDENPHFKISLLHIDTDIYEPAVVILENFYDRVVKGGIIAFDDYGTFPGETQAVDDFLEKKNLKIKKLSLSHIPAYVIKP